MAHRQFGGSGSRRRPPYDPEVARLVRNLGLTRRGFLRGSAMLAGGVMLSACGISSESAQNAPAAGGPTTGAATAPAGGGTAATGPEEQVLNFSNWQLYIDYNNRETQSPTLQQFQRETGIEVNYFEDINSNDEYFGKIRNQLANGESIGRDIMVLTDWMAGRLIDLGWLTEIDHANIPNVEANLVEALRDVAFDPDRTYSVPWQSGLTGIGYDPAVVGREITSVNDLFDEALAGRVTFLSEMRDTMGLVMAGMGIDPVNHEFSEYEEAIAKVQEAVNSGQIRQFTGNEYAQGLARGNIAAALAWSGDVVQLQFDNPELKFVVPDEGAMLWSDNMLVPAGAEHPTNAETWMNYVYQPEVAAQIAAWVNYITPVQGAKEVMAEEDPELAEFELIFPSPDLLQNTFDFKPLDEQEEQEYQNLFQGVMGA